MSIPAVGIQLGAVAINAGDQCERVELSRPRELASYYVHRDGRTTHVGDPAPAARIGIRRYLGDGAGVGTDLGDGVEGFVPKPYNASKDPAFPPAVRLDDYKRFLDSIMGTQAPLGANLFDIVVMRGVLTKICCTPACRRDAWRIEVHVHNGVLHLRGVETPADVRDRMAQTAEQNRFCFMGFKYEEVACEALGQGLPQEEAAAPGVVDCNEYYCTTYTMKMGGVRLMVTAEVDCYEPDGRSGVRYVELKTAVDPTSSDRAAYSFKRYKLLKIWLQSFLAGVPVVVVGFRTREGRLVRTQRFNTMEIPRLVRNDAGMWKPTVCLAFGAQILRWVKRKIGTQNGTFTLAYDAPFDQVRLFRSKERPWLPNPYKQWLNNKRAAMQTTPAASGGLESTTKAAPKPDPAPNHVQDAALTTKNTTTPAGREGTTIEGTEPDLAPAQKRPRPVEGQREDPPPPRPQLEGEIPKDAQ